MCVRVCVRACAYMPASVHQCMCVCVRACVCVCWGGGGRGRGGCANSPPFTSSSLTHAKRQKPDYQDNSSRLSVKDKTSFLLSRFFCFLRVARAASGAQSTSGAPPPPPAAPLAKPGLTADGPHTCVDWSCKKHRSQRPPAVCIRPTPRSAQRSLGSRLKVHITITDTFLFFLLLFLFFFFFFSLFLFFLLLNKTVRLGFYLL